MAFLFLMLVGLVFLLCYVMLDRVLIGIVFGGGVGNDDDDHDDAHFILYSLPLLSAIDLI